MKFKYIYYIAHTFTIIEQYSIYLLPELQDYKTMKELNNEEIITNDYTYI